MHSFFCIRYEAQECFCGEARCVGFLGGKTQTDVGAMDELYIDGQFVFVDTCPLACWSRFNPWVALGITADVEEFGLKGSKTKKGKKMDVDYNVSQIAIHSWTIDSRIIAHSLSWNASRSRMFQKSPLRSANLYPTNVFCRNYFAESWCVMWFLIAWVDLSTNVLEAIFPLIRSQKILQFKNSWCDCMASAWWVWSWMNTWITRRLSKRSECSHTIIILNWTLNLIIFVLLSS